MAGIGLGDGGDSLRHGVSGEDSDPARRSQRIDVETELHRKGLVQHEQRRIGDRHRLPWLVETDQFASERVVEVEARAGGDSHEPSLRTLSQLGSDTNRDDNRSMGSRRTDGERIEVTGVVQGVGFRPFVHRLATESGLDGFVGNDSTRVFIEVTGPRERIDEFARRLVAEAPPLATVESVTRTASAATEERGFRIVESRCVAGARTLIAPDTAVCDDCVTEMNDPGDRRFGHAFITCTNCGPRFTIIRDLPYDRPNTTMAVFDMCDVCAAEYDDPTDRRYHAQPICCHDCGPVLHYRSAHGDGAATFDDDPLAAALATIRAGGTVAVKGLGGYHLACDATDDAAVERLRQRKHRPDKPFAVMVADLDDARRLAEVSDAEATQLLAPARPIVLLRARADASVSALVAPGNPMLGVMLPSTPVQHLLFRIGAPALVMTSGNLAGEPLAYIDDDAVQRLSGLCDGFLMNDREIHVPCDDSVVRVAGDVLLPIRRARGFAPLPVPVGRGRRSVLAVGGELKNTFCLGVDRARLHEPAPRRHGEPRDARAPSSASSRSSNGSTRSHPRSSPSMPTPATRPPGGRAPTIPIGSSRSSTTTPTSQP